MPERWCCPLCGHLNDASVGEFSRKGYCQSNACAGRRAPIVRSGQRAVPEMWMSALSFVSGKEWVEA